MLAFTGLIKYCLIPFYNLSYFFIHVKLIKLIKLAKSLYIFPYILIKLIKLVKLPPSFTGKIEAKLASLISFTCNVYMGVRKSCVIWCKSCVICPETAIENTSFSISGVPRKF